VVEVVFVHRAVGHAEQFGIGFLHGR
jgi:hypothetical protein